MGNSNKKKKSILLIILFIFFLAVFVFAGIKLIIHFIPKKENYDSFKSTSSAPVQSEVSVVLPKNPINFPAVQKKTENICAWLKISSSKIIDYPVLQSSEDMEEDFYLDHDLDGSYKRAGSLYIQKYNYNDFEDPVTVIYGHNMLNGTMFGTLKKFRDRNYFNSHKTFNVYTPGHILKYNIFSAFVYDDRHIINSFNSFYEKEDFQKFIDECLDPTSLVKNVREGVNVTTDDKLVVLSTCTSKDSERYLVVGVLIKDTLTQ